MVFLLLIVLEISLTQTRRQSYIDMTIKMMQDFGGVQSLDRGRYFISNDNKYSLLSII